MKREVNRLFVFVFLMLFACILNASSEETQERRSYERGDLPRMITVMKASVPPAIDGIMEPGEWESATLVTGLIETEIITQWGPHPPLHNVASHQSKFWITYDDNYLYVAHHSPPPPEISGTKDLIIEMLQNTETRHDANVNSDDCITLSIINPAYPGGDKYIIQVNSIGTTFECVWYNHYAWEPDILEKGLGRVPGITLGWDPSIRNASTLTLDGWFFEMAIPWSELGPHISRPSDGQVKHMNFGRTWKKVMEEFHAWKAHDSMSPAGEVVFSGDEGVLVQLSDIGQVFLGQAAFNASITNMHSTGQALSVSVSTDSGEVSDTVEIVLAPGETSDYSFQSLIADFATTTITFGVEYSDTGEKIHVTTLPVIRPTAPEILTRRYMSLDKMKFETDISFIGAADLLRTAIGLTLVHRETGRRVFRRTFRGFASYRPVLELSTGDWKPGIYDAHFAISAPGMRRYETSVEYYHPELPEWWDNTYGLEDLQRDKVPYPWTNIVVADNSVNVWGRQYLLEDSLLPKQITTLGYPVLNGPARILLQTSDGETIDTSLADAGLEWTLTNHTRVEAHGTVQGNSVSLRNELWAEYDGLLWNRISIIPNGSTTVDSMVLEIPLTEEFTDVINAMDYSLRGTGKLKDTGYTSGATRAVWLGNGDGGLQWYCETDGWFFTRDTGSILKVDVKDGRATMTVTMIDIPTQFDTPHHIEFGLLATPVRPKTWGTPEHSRYRGIRGGMHNHRDYHLTQFTCGIENARPGLYVSPNRTGFVEELELFGDEWRIDEHSRGRNATMASQSYRNYSAWRHWRRQFENVCDVTEGAQCKGFIHLYYDVTGARTSANPYVGTGYRRRDGSLAPTTPYLAERDITRRLYNIALGNPESHPRDSWIGYHNSSSPEMIYMGFANENWNAENLNSAINEHQQTYIGLVDPAMYRAEYMGHNFGWPVFFLGQGRINREWVEANGGPEAVNDQIVGLNFLHDGGGVCCIMPSGILRQVSQREQKAAQKHNFLCSHWGRHWKYRFIPYWRQDIVKLPEADIHASIYLAQPSRLLQALEGWDGEIVARGFSRHARRTIASYFGPGIPDPATYGNIPGNMVDYIVNEVVRSRRQLEELNDKAIIIVYNDSEWEGELRLEVDWNKLGLGTPETLSVENAVHSTGFRLEKRTDEEGNEYEEAVFFERPEEYARIEDGLLVFPMTRHNYRMIVLERK